MNLVLTRKEIKPRSTIGELFIDGKFECFVLEDTDRKLEVVGAKGKIYGITAIPRGKYTVVITWSNRFKQLMPLLLNVPFFEGIRIHKGNVPEHSHGCLLVGNSKGVESVGGSSIAYDRLFRKLSIASKKEKITIEIK
ncbi:MAG: DUF5675 family protein [Bacteroidia bacterium]